MWDRIRRDLSHYAGGWICTAALLMALVWAFTMAGGCNE